MCVPCLAPFHLLHHAQGESYQITSYFIEQHLEALRGAWVQGYSCGRRRSHSCVYLLTDHVHSVDLHVHVHMHESSEGLSSTTILKPGGIPPSACSGTPNLHVKKRAKAKTPRCLALWTRDGRLKALLSLRNSPYPPQWLRDMGIKSMVIVYYKSGQLNHTY